MEEVHKEDWGGGERESKEEANLVEFVLGVNQH